MTKITLQDVASFTNEQSALATVNSNSAIIETASDNFLSRDGTTPNQMVADLDMNSNQILNIGDPLDMNGSRIIGLDDAVALDEPVTLNQFQAGVASSGAAPVTCSFVTVSSEPNLVAERKLAVGTGLSLTDAGANSTVTLDIPNNAVTFARMQDIATDSLIGRDTAATGDPENITLGAALSMSGAGALQVTDDGITNTKLANMAVNTVKGRITAGTGDPEDLSGANVKTIAGLATSTTANRLARYTDTAGATGQTLITEDG